MVDESPWPLISSLVGGLVVISILKWFDTQYPSFLLLLSLATALLLISQWWKDVSKEGESQGHHSKGVENGLQWGIALFICSEAILFLRLFWAFFHSSLAPNIELALRWPPVGIYPLNPSEVPLLNTAILISSGGRVTWAHHALTTSMHSEVLFRLGLTITLGAYFTLLQGIEYWEAPFTIRDRVYGSSFFMATGFHGFHVIVGTVFLRVCWCRMLLGSFSGTHHFGFVAASWYWHFVDVVWIFLFITIYIWGRV